MTPTFSCACITQLGEILQSSNRHDTNVKYHCLYTQQKTVKLLIDIKHTDLDTMKECLHVIKRDNPSAVKLVWELFKQYIKMKPDLLLCSYCKIRSRIDIQRLSVNLWRNGIISDNLYEAIYTSSQNNGLAESMWNDLENELKLYTTHDHIIEAIADTLSDCYHMDEDVKAEMKRLIEKASFEMSCHCQKHYFDVPRHANNNPTSICTLETDASVSENEAKRNENAEQVNKRKTKNRSTSASRRKSLPTQDSKCQKYGSTSPTKQVSGERQIERLRSWPSDNAVHVGKTITVDSKKSKVININNNGRGPVNVGNRFVKVGKAHRAHLSDTSNDTESQKSSPYGSDSDTGHSVVSTVNKENESINVSKNPGPLCKFPQDYRPEFMVKTSRRQRTVSESAIQKATSVEKLNITQQSVGAEERK